MKELTKKQRKVFNFIKRHFKKHDTAPTRSEIRVKFEFASTNSVVANLDALERKGYIVQPKGITLTGKE